MRSPLLAPAVQVNAYGVRLQPQPLGLGLGDRRLKQRSYSATVFSIVGLQSENRTLRAPRTYKAPKD